MLALLFAALSPVSAETVDDGFQAAVFPGAFSFAERQLEGRSFDVFEDHLGGRYDCWDELGIEDFNLQIPIEAVNLALKDSALEVTVGFGSIYGRDMLVYGLDSDTWDTCPEFEVQLSYVELENAELVLALRPAVVDGLLQLELAEDPRLTGTLDTDFEDLPDDLVLYFFEEKIFEIAREELANALPELTASYLSDPVVLGQQYGEFDVDLGLDKTEVSSRRLRMAARTSLSWSGNDGCPTADRLDGAPGLSPTLDFGDGEGSSLGVGVTEGMINEMFLSAWRGGYFCFTEANVDEFLGYMAGSFDPGVAGLGASAWLAEPPSVTIGERGIELFLGGAGVRAFGDVDGEREELLDMELDIRGLLELGVDGDLSAFVMSLNELELDIHSLHATHITKESDESDENLKRLLEEWVAGWAASQAQDVTLFSSLYHTLGMVIRVDRMRYTEGGIKVFTSLFDEDDPEVDRAPPDTSFELLDSTPDSVLIAMDGADDRPGQLSYSYQVNDAGWSAWSTEQQILLEGLAPAVYEIQMRSRDAWLNIDPEPAVGWLEVTGGTEPVKGCGCASSPGGGGGLALLMGILGLTAARRRR